MFRLVSMRHVSRLLPLAIVLATFTSLTTTAPTTAPSSGPLVAVGGGGTVDAICAELLRLGGDGESRMLLVPCASEDPSAGAELLEFWKEKGFERAEVLAEDGEQARLQIAAAGVLWMGGGDQKRLVDELRRRGLDALIAERHRAGAVVGGTSAGAAALSKAMILGGETADLEAVKRGGTALVEGLDLLDAAIFDQHYLRRRRFARLLAAVLDHPKRIGIGVDERTAAIVRGTAIEVVGEGQVLVIDARAARIEPSEEGALHSARGVRLELLRSGDRFDWSDK